MAVIAVENLSIVLFRVSALILALILGLQLLGETGVVPFDFTALYTLQQLTYVWIVLLVTILGFIEARTQQNKAGGGLEGFTIGVLISYLIAFVGLFLTVFIFIGGDIASLEPYEFSSGTMNDLIGYYLLVGVLLIFINSRKSIFRIRSFFRQQG